jgi:hypothetical protein
MSMGICLPFFHLADQLDMLESQVQNIRDNLATKYVGTNGIKKPKSQSFHIPTIITTNAMQISKVQSIPNTKNNFELRNQMPTVSLATLKTAKSKAKPKHKILLIGDSHARGCASKLQEKLKEQYEVIGYVKPGAGATVLTKTAQQEISGLTEEDTLIYCGGTNDIAQNNTSRGIKFIHHYLLKNQHTNIILMGAPHRYDLMESLIINEETQGF